MILFKQWYASRNRPSTAGLNVRHLHYIATRPGAEYNQGQAFGLFGQLARGQVPGDLRDLKMAEDVVFNASKEHTVYRAVLSAGREDAENYGLYHRERWEELVKANVNLIAREMNIAPNNLRWVASFHKEQGHPHVHLFYWDNGTGIQPEGVSRERMEVMSELVRSALGRDVYRDDFTREQNTQRETADEIRRQMQALFREANPEKSLNIRQLMKAPETELLARGLLEIARAVPKTGSLRYAYLPEELKSMVDALTTRCIASVPELYQMVESYKESTKQIAAYYGNGECEVEHNLIKAMGKLRKEMGNELMKAVRDVLASDRSFLDTVTSPQFAAKLECDEDETTSSQIAAKLEETDMPDFPKRKSRTESWAGVPTNIHAAESWWSREYRKARVKLYDSADSENNFVRAKELLEAEALRGNGFAMYDRGQMSLKGLGCEKDEEEAQSWFHQAFQAITDKEVLSGEKERPYYQYRIGKLYAYGHGANQDKTQAAEWWQKATDAGNTFAAYSLAGLYRRGDGVERSDERALRLYRLAAEDGNAYAAYSLGQMYREGTDTDRAKQEADLWYEQAYRGFLSIEQRNPDDKLYYRLGRMNLDGIGTQIDMDKAEEYFIKAVDLGNDDARYGLARLYLQHGHSGYDPDVAQELLTEAAQNGHAQSQYLLGKLYLQGDEFPLDIEAGREWLEKAVAQENTAAASILGKAYLEGTVLQHDDKKALELLTWAVEKDSTQAGYILGKAYLTGEHIPVDPLQAEKLLKWSSGKGNIYASIALARAYLDGIVLKKDILQALQLLKEPAQSGNAYAQCLLGRTLVTEESVLNIPEGVRYLTDAVAAGSDPAELQLGILYFFGKDGVLERDKNRGLDYLNAAAGHGNEFAQELLSSISRNQIATMLCGMMHLGSQLASQQNARAAGSGSHSNRELSKEAKKDRKQEQAQGSDWEQN